MIFLITENGTPFRKDRAKLMNVPVGYDDNVEKLNTHADLLPKDDILETTGIRRSRIPSRSMLSNITNKGILRNNKSSSIGGNAVTWSEVTHGQMARGSD